MMKKSIVFFCIFALLVASGASFYFLHKARQTSLRNIFLACEKGEITGYMCCEDLGGADVYDPLNSCSLIGPHNHDPLGVREKEEEDFDNSLQAK